MKPEIIAFTTISLDGGISIRGRRLRLSSDRDLERLHRLRSMVDAVMVGANTVIIDNPLLTIRLPGYRGRQPWRIVVDGRLRTPSGANVYDTSTAPTILVTDEDQAGNPKLEEYVGRGVEVLFTKHIGEWLDLDDAVRKVMDEYGIKRILVEGGGILLGTMLRQGLVDKIIVTISSMIIGMDKTSYIGVDLPSPIKLKLERAEVDRITGEVTLEYRPLYTY